MNQIINMVMRLFLRKAINRGIGAGVNMAARRGKGAKPSDPAAERQQTAQGKNMSKRAKQAMRVARRVGRF